MTSAVSDIELGGTAAPTSEPAAVIPAATAAPSPVIASGWDLVAPWRGCCCCRCLPRHTLSAVFFILGLAFLALGVQYALAVLAAAGGVWGVMFFLGATVGGALADPDHTKSHVASVATGVLGVLVMLAVLGSVAVFGLYGIYFMCWYDSSGGCAFAAVTAFLMYPVVVLTLLAATLRLARATWELQRRGGGGGSGEKVSWVAVGLYALPAGLLLTGIIATASQNVSQNNFRYGWAQGTKAAGGVMLAGAVLALLCSRARLRGLLVRPRRMQLLLAALAVVHAALGAWLNAECPTEYPTDGRGIRNCQSEKWEVVYLGTVAAALQLGHAWALARVDPEV